MIDSIEDERLVPYRSLRSLKSQFVTEGKKGVAALFDSELEIESLLFESKHHQLAKEYQKNHPHIVLYEASQEVVSQIVGYKMHQGIMALAKIPDPHPLDQLKGNTLVLQGLANAENVGAICRTAAAFGIRNILCDRACSPLYLRRTVKTSMGTLFNLKHYYSSNLVDDLTKLKVRGFSVVGADPAQENIALNEVKVESPVLLIIGSEGEGISHDVKRACDQLVRIPIDLSVDSLNAAIASSIFLYTFSLYE